MIFLGAARTHGTSRIGKIGDAAPQHGTVCDEAGAPIEDLVISSANQLRILPNHACATGAQHGGAL
jgi:D-serine deaminase-like pyridoxal phosphate-dependent protein